MAAAFIDLTKRAWTHSRGDITAIGTWIRTENRWRPCLVLIRTGEEYSDHTIPCIVTIDKAWIWSEDVGDARAAARTAFEFVRALRLAENDPRQPIRIGMLIHDLLGDLLHIPPYVPDTRPEPIAEVTITDQAGRVREVELTDDV